MLQRAASNAYSWWWASHVRNNQSKWLDYNLHDMEERIHTILKLLGEEAESFSKRAEMYYKRRPEVMHLVEELYRSYRALVERYDHISKELHKANHTIASAFPDQVQYALLEEGDDYLPKAITPIDASKVRKPIVDAILKQKRESRAGGRKDMSELSKEKAEEEIGKLQKSILALQTEKEFVKSLYENGISKYWELEKQMGDLQEEVFLLQDQFNVSVQIEDQEARTLMTEKILRLCNNVIVKIRDRQKDSIMKAREEFQRAKVDAEKFSAIKAEYGLTPPAADDQAQAQAAEEHSIASVIGENEAYSFNKELLEMQSIHDKIKQFFELSSDFTLDEIVEKVDNLANKAIDLELSISSANAQISRLNGERLELEKSIEELQEEKTVLTANPKDLRTRLKQAEEKLGRIKGLETCIGDQESAVREMLFDVISCFRDISKTFVAAETVDQASPAVATVEETKDGTAIADVTTPLPETEAAEGSSTALNKSNVNEEEIVEYILSETRDEIPVTDEQIVTDEDIVIAEHKEALENIDKEIEALNESIARFDQEEISREEQISVESSQSAAKIDSLENDAMAGELPSGELEPKDAPGIEDAAEAVAVAEKQQDDEMSGDLGEQIDVESLQTAAKISSLENAASASELSIGDLEPKDAPEVVLGIEDDAEKKQQNEEMSGDFGDDAKIRDNRSSGELGTESSFAPSESQAQLGHGEQQGWRDMLMDGMEGGESLLLAEYTSVLRNYNEAKKRLTEIERRNADTNSLIRELKNANASKEVELLSLRHQLSSSKAAPALTSGNSFARISAAAGAEGTEDDDASFEEKFRREVDGLQEGNFQFMLRFTSSFLRAQELDAKFAALRQEAEQPRDGEREGGDDAQQSQGSPAAEDKLRELKTDLTVWMEQNAMLREELQSTLSALGNLQQDIVEALHASMESDGGGRFTPYQAARFQGEILNMQHEGNKLESDLQAASDKVRGLQGKVEEALSRMHERPEIAGGARKSRFKNHPGKARVPLRDYLFDSKESKPKRKSIFSYVKPATQRHHGSK